MTGLLSTPMDATPRDGIVGYDEFGRPVYRSLLGHNYGEGLGATPHQPSAAQQRGQEMMRANQSGQMWQMDNREDWGTPGQAVGGLLGLLAEGALNGIATPGRAARGDPVTYGDVMDTAMDWGILAAPGRAPAGALRSGGMANTPNPIFQNASDAVDRLNEIYGGNFSLSTHPTSWGNSAYVSGRLPGPNGTYTDVGFRLSDHDVGDFRRATDGIPTINFVDTMTPDDLVEAVRQQYEAATPALEARAASRAHQLSMAETATEVWSGLSGNERGQIAEAFRQIRPRYFNNRPWRNLSEQERGLFAMREGLL